MRFSTNQHPCDGGIDLPARRMDVCMVSQDGAILLHRQMQAAPDPLLTAMAPSRDALVVAVACLFTWYGLADRWAAPGLPFVLGHALSLQAIQGGPAKNDTSDAPKLAVLLRGGLLPKASVSPAAMRAPRALLRRRPPLRHQRAERLSHGHKTPSQDHVPEMGKQSADTAPRDGVAARCDEAAVPNNLAVAVALLTSDAARLRDLELSLGKTAKHHDAHPWSWLHTVPGLGKRLRLVWRDDIHRIERCPSGQAGASSGRLVQGSQASGGTRVGTAGTQIGQAHLTGACGEAAALCLRHHAAGQTSLARWETKHDQGTALRLLAHHLARAVYSRRQRQTAFAMDSLLRRGGSSVAEPKASLAPPGEEPAARPPAVLLDGVCARPGGPRPVSPEPDALLGPPRWLVPRRRPVAPGDVCGPAPEPGTHWRLTTRSQPCAEDGMRGRSHVEVAEPTPSGSLPASRMWRWHRNTCVVQPYVVGWDLRPESTSGHESNG